MKYYIRINLSCDRYYLGFISIVYLYTVKFHLLSIEKLKIPNFL